MTGITEGTFYRDQAWSFFRLGRYIERADQTTRLLDVEYHPAARPAWPAPAEQEAGQWHALLRSASGYHAFRRVHPSGIDPADVARFLIFDTRLPAVDRLLRFEIVRMISQLRGEFRLRNASAPSSARMRS